MKTFLLTALEVVHKAVLFATPCAAAMIFIWVSGASVVGAHVQAAVIR